MRTIGEILKNVRIEKKLDLEEVEKATKIRAKYLEALEKNDFAKIPGGAPTAKGFIKNYAEYLNLSSTEILAVFRRDFRESKTGQIIPQGYYEPLNKTKFAWNPKLTAAGAIVLLVAALSAYLFFQVSSYFSSPDLTIVSPANGVVVAQSEIEIEGKSDPDAAIYVNDELVAQDEKGLFRTKVSLFAGANNVEVESVSRQGKTSKLTLQVNFQPVLQSEQSDKIED